MLHDKVDSIKEKLEGGDNGNVIKIKGKVVLMKKNVLDLCDFSKPILDDIFEFIGNHVSFELIISTTVANSNNVGKARVGKPTYLSNWISSPTSVSIRESNFSMTFEWEEEYRVPEAVIVKNNDHSEFYLKSLTLEKFSGKGKIHFACNSWICPTIMTSILRE